MTNYKFLGMEEESDYSLFPFRGMSKFFKFLFIVFILAIFFSIFFSFGFEVGKGQQAGIISEVQREGIIWRPPVVHLLNIQPTYSTSQTAYAFGASQELADLAEQYSLNNTKVMIYYETKYIVPNWEFSSRTIITKIEVIK